MDLVTLAAVPALGVRLKPIHAFVWHQSGVDPWSFSLPGGRRTYSTMTARSISTLPVCVPVHRSRRRQPSCRPRKSRLRCSRSRIRRAAQDFVTRRRRSDLHRARRLSRLVATRWPSRSQTRSSRLLGRAIHRASTYRTRTALSPPGSDPVRRLLVHGPRPQRPQSFRKIASAAGQSQHFQQKKQRTQARGPALEATIRVQIKRGLSTQQLQFRRQRNGQSRACWCSDHRSMANDA
jgi:hypothetical protein